MDQRDGPKRRLSREIFLITILVLFSLNAIRADLVEAQAKSSAQLEAVLAAKKAELDAKNADISQINAAILLIDGIDKLPEGRLKREAKDKAYRAYLQYVENLDPDLSGFAIGAEAAGIITPEEMKNGLLKKKSKYDRKVSGLNKDIADLQTKIQQAKVEELSQQVQQSQPGAGSGGTKSQSGPPQPKTYAAPPPTPPTAAAPPPPPMLPPGSYLTGFQVYCPGEVVAGDTIACTATGVYVHDPYKTVDLTGRTTWEWQREGAPGWTRRPSPVKTDLKKGGGNVWVRATFEGQTVERIVLVKAGKTGMDGGTTPQSTGTGKPAGGGGCGPGTSCKCAGGATGHISCDTGKCHCGGG